MQHFVYVILHWAGSTLRDISVTAHHCLMTLKKIYFHFPSSDVYFFTLLFFFFFIWPHHVSASLHFFSLFLDFSPPPSISLLPGGSGVLCSYSHRFLNLEKVLFLFVSSHSFNILLGCCWWECGKHEWNGMSGRSYSPCRVSYMCRVFMCM